MLVLNECRISEDGKNLIIEASVDSLNYYNGVYIKSLIVDTNETWSCNGPSAKPVYEREFEVGNQLIRANMPVFAQDVENVMAGDCGCGNVYTDTPQGTRNIRIYLSAKDMNLATLDKNIFFVYITAAGYPDPLTPCGMDKATIMGVAMNLRPFYNYAMGYIKSMVNTNCETPKALIDYFLKFKSLEMAIKTGNFPIAFKMWQYLISGGSTPSSPSKGCGCHGN